MSAGVVRARRVRVVLAWIGVLVGALGGFVEQGDEGVIVRLDVNV